MTSKIRKPPRESASLIIASYNSNSTTSYDYNVLLCKRSEHTAYFLDHCVFPGGVCDDFDEDEAWIQYFHEFGVTEAQLNSLLLLNTERPQILQGNSSKCARDISLRITALRETFEEVGVLICRDKLSLQESSDFGRTRDDFQRVYWQTLVHNDPREFLKLCKHLKVVPDLWCLSEWSVWRSPATASKKFDTVFYIVAMQQKPKLLIEKTEIEDFIWQPPPKLLDAYSQRHIWLAPIQVYELSRLTNVLHFERLQKFSQARNKKGSTLLMPVYYRCVDGLVGLLPGDDMYPHNPDNHTENITTESTVEQFRRQSRRRHRLVYRNDMYDMQLDMSISPIDSHLSAVPFNAISKL